MKTPKPVAAANFSRHLSGTCLAILATFFLPLVLSSQVGLKYIPSNADMVVTVNLPSLDKKVNLAQLQQYDFYQAMLKEMYQSPEFEADSLFQAYFDAMLADPASLGFDHSEPFFVVVEKVGFDTYTTFIQKMGDRTKYVNSIKKLKGELYEEHLIGEGDKMFWQKGSELFAWNDEVVLNVFHAKGFDPNNLNFDYGTEFDEVVEEMEDISYEEEIPEDYEILTEEEEPADSTVEEEVVIEEYFGEDLSEITFIGIEGDTIPLGEDFDWTIDTAGYYGEEMGGHYEEWAAEPDTAAFEWAVKLLDRDFLQPITRNEQYAQAERKGDDVHFWLDYAGFNNGIGSMDNPGGMSNLDQAFNMGFQFGQSINNIFNDGAYISMGLNFEEGRMAIRTQAFFNEEMKRFYQRSMDGKFNKKFMRYIKGGDEMFGYFYVNYNVKNTIEETKAALYRLFDKTPQYGQAASDAMKIIGIFIDEEAIGNLLKGDLMVAISGIQTVEVTQQTYEYDAEFNFTAKDTVVMQQVPVFTALASYGNGKDIQKFIDLGLHSNVLVPEGKYYKVVIPGGNEFGDMYLAKHDGLLIFSNNQYLMRQNLESGFAKKLRLSKSHCKMLRKNASVVYWNIPNTIRAAAGNQADSNVGMTGYLNSLGKEFYSLEMRTDKQVGNSVKSEMMVNMTQKDTNALTQFFNFVNDLYLEFIGGAKI